MIRIDDTLLEEIGLIALPKADRDQLLRQIYETLEMRVGMRLAERMTDQQLDEFERFIDTNDEAGALKWLETNFPDYKQVVADELDKLKAEIKKDSTKIMETMQAQGTQVPAAAPPATTTPQSQPAAFGAPAQPQPPASADNSSFAPASQPGAAGFSPMPTPQPSQAVTPEPASLPPLPPLPSNSVQPTQQSSAPGFASGQTTPATPLTPIQPHPPTADPAAQPVPQQDQPQPPAGPAQDSGIVPPPPVQ